MKQCPKCSRSYDDSQSFCLMDGTPLTVESETETVIRQPPPTARKKGRLLLWFGLTALAVFIGAICVTGILIYQFGKRGENAQIDRSGKTTASPSPSSTAKKSPIPTRTAGSPIAEPSPKPDAPSSEDEDADDITPIAWNTSAAAFTGENGRTYKFSCPADGTAGTIWGSDVYTQDSSICTAAVHAGLFTLESGGVVTIEFRPGRLTYGSTVRNGITSNTYGEYPRSFVVR